MLWPAKNVPRLVLGRESDHVDIEIRQGIEIFMKRDQIEARQGPALSQLPACQPFREKDRGDAGNEWAVTGPGNDEQALVALAAVRAQPADDHVKSASVGPDRIEQERELQKSFRMNRKRLQYA